MEWSEPCSAENLFPLGRAVSYDGSKVFARLQHRITATQRNYERALKDLQRLGPQPPAGRPIPKREPVSAPAPPTQIGFVSSPVQPQPPNPATTQILPPPSLTQLPQCVIIHSSE
jgi:hypothetical protein